VAGAIRGLRGLPRALVEELARVTTRAQQEWDVARRRIDYPHFRPWLERVFALKREEAEALGYEDSPYDALLEEYEPGARGAELAALFDALRAELVPLANALTHAPRRADPALLSGWFPVERQRALSEAVAAGIGFDFGSGRLDATVHPFCSCLGPGDCRLTTRYREDCLADGVFATLHEAGHGLYEQGLPAEHHGTPLAEAPSLGLHESQSRLWENAVGRGRAFWQHFYALARSLFPSLAGVSLDDFHFAVNHVAPSPLRISADEVTYNLHILIRFELERVLLSGDLKVADLPGAWGEAYRHYLGVVPANDYEGCLQDGHWGSGLVGYFPTYTLGNLYAAQLFARAATDVGDLDGQMIRGRFDGLLGWLREHVYRHGCRYPAAVLVERATGAPPDHRALIEGLRRKYGELYGLSVRAVGAV
jgi:carboxypeptidase Taq